MGWYEALRPILIIILVICIIGIIAYLIYYFAPKSQVEYELKDSENDPYMKFISECRTKLVNHMIGAIQDAWLLKPDDFEVDGALLGTGTSLITIPYQNHLIKFYIYWDRKRVVITHISNQDGKEFCKKLKLKIIDDAVNLEKIYKFFHKEKLVVALKQNEKDAIVKKMCEMVEKLSPAEKEKFVLEQWQAFHDEATNLSIIDFASVTSLMFALYKEEFEKYLNNQKKDR